MLDKRLQSKHWCHLLNWYRPYVWYCQKFQYGYAHILIKRQNSLRCTHFYNTVYTHICFYAIWWWDIPLNSVVFKLSKLIFLYTYSITKHSPFLHDTFVHFLPLWSRFPHRDLKDIWSYQRQQNASTHTPCLSGIEYSALLQVLVSGNRRSVILQPLLSDTRYKITVTPIYADEESTALSKSSSGTTCECEPTNTAGVIV